MTPLFFDSNPLFGVVPVLSRRVRPCYLLL
jgi:hypothetical protein